MVYQRLHFGFHGLHLTTEAVAAFGELLLRGDLWGDQQLIPRDWVELATRRHVDTLQLEDDWASPDFLCGYGYQFWIPCPCPAPAWRYICSRR